MLIYSQVPESATVEATRDHGASWRGSARTGLISEKLETKESSFEQQAVYRAACQVLLQQVRATRGGVPRPLSIRQKAWLRPSAAEPPERFYAACKYGVADGIQLQPSHGSLTLSNSPLSFSIF